MAAAASATRTVTIGCDHGAFALKQELLEFANAKYAGSITFRDVGVFAPDRVDYPDIAKDVCMPVQKKEADAGIVLCGSGIGISIAANKLKGIRCALCHDYYTAEMSRKHNDANVLAMGGRTTGPEVAKQMLEVFLSTAFEGGRHADRVAKIHEIEKMSEAEQQADGKCCC